MAALEKFWKQRSRAEKVALAAGVLATSAAVAVVLAPELAVAALTGAVTSAAGWVVRKGFAG